MKVFRWLWDYKELVGGVVILILARLVFTKFISNRAKRIRGKFIFVFNVDEHSNDDEQNKQIRYEK